jgi:hypothetical protein
MLVIASEAKQSRAARDGYEIVYGLLRRYAPRNDERAARTGLLVIAHSRQAAYPIAESVFSARKGVPRRWIRCRANDGKSFKTKI